MEIIESIQLHVVQAISDYDKPRRHIFHAEKLYRRENEEGSLEYAMFAGECILHLSGKVNKSDVRHF
jgi:hypothetical protein